MCGAIWLACQSRSCMRSSVPRCGCGYAANLFSNSALAQIVTRSRRFNNAPVHEKARRPQPETRANIARNIKTGLICHKRPAKALSITLAKRKHLHEDKLGGRQASEQPQVKLMAGRPAGRLATISLHPQSHLRQSLHFNLREKGWKSVLVWDWACV